MSVETETTAEDAHPAGVWRAVTLAAFAACFLWIPYVVPGLETWQVVGPGDGLPLAGLFADESLRGGPRLAGAFRRRPLLAQDDEALMERAPLPPPIPLEARRSRRRPRRPGEESREQVPLARVEPEEYAGLTRSIEDSRGAMRAFYRQLARVARGRAVLARMGVYGTSINGADRVTSQLRRLLAERFGDGGKGWVPVAPGWRYQHHQDVEWSAEGWRTFVVNRSDGPLDRYGFGGVLAVSRGPQAHATIATADDAPGEAVSVFRVFHQAWPSGGDLTIQIDDGAPRTLSTRAEAVEDRVETIEVEDGAHTLRLRAADGSEGDDLRLYGVVMERGGPGVVVDGLALIGAFTRVLRLFDEEHLAAQVQLRDPDLLVFWMGANDAVSESVAFEPETYVRQYRGILRRYQDANPGMSCMVMGILDKGERVRGQIRTRPRVPRMIAAQREAARAEGCAFFDSFAATGGEGAMGRWYRASPRLVTDDLGHLTAAGARVVGTLLYRALMKGFDDWIADGEPAPGE